jgi:hypothetical protein
VAVSGGEEKRPPVTWETIEEVADQVELDRWAAMSDDEVDAALRDAKVDPARLERLGRVARGGPAAARSTEGSKVASLDEARRRRERWTKWAVVAAAAAVVLVVLAAKRRDIQAWLSPEPIQKDHWTEPSPDDLRKKVAGEPSLAPPDYARANELRKQALAACERKAYDACEKGLDEAKKLDPAGEDQPRVGKARALIDDVRIHEEQRMP